MSLGLIDYALGIVVLGALIGIYVCNKQQAINPKAQMMSLVLLAVVVIAGGGLMFNSGLLASVGIGSSSDERVANASTQNYASQGFVIGNKIAEANPAAKVLVIVQESDLEKINAGESTRITEMVKALKSSPIGENVTIDFPVPSRMGNASPDMLAGISFGQLVSAKDYNSMLSKHANVDAIIFAAEVPQDSDEMLTINVLKKKNNKTMIYFVANIISPNKAKELLVNKNITGAVQRKRGAKLAETAPSDFNQAFEESYVFIDANTK